MNEVRPIREQGGVKHHAEDVLRFIVRFKQENDGNSPTMREICDGCGIPSLSHLDVILNKLDEAGWIQREGGKRGIRVAGGSWSYQQPACVRTMPPRRFRAAGEGE